MDPIADEDLAGLGVVVEPRREFMTVPTAP
jgi:hypothetical protein